MRRPRRSPSRGVVRLHRYGLTRPLVPAQPQGVTPPEGALGIDLFEDHFLQDPYPLYARMHASGPVHRIGDSGFYAVSSWDAITEALTRCEDFSSNLTATMTYHPDATVTPLPMDGLGGVTQVLATADDPAHAIHRKALTPRLAAKRIRAVEPFITETSARLWDDAARDGRIEWMGAMANRLPMMIVGGIIGVPEEDVDKLVRWGYAATQLLEGLLTADQLTAAGIAVMELSGYITDQFHHAATNPGDNLLGDLATACATGELDRITAQVMMITLFSAGGESTASLIGSAAWILATRPDVQRQVRDQPELRGAFLEEVLRYEPPFRGHYRHVVNDTTLCGTDLEAGSRLLLLWGAANRDPTHFHHPDQFRLEPPRREGPHQLRQGRALLHRRRTRPMGDQHRARSTPRAHHPHPRPRPPPRWLPSLLVRRLQHLPLAWT